MLITETNKQFPFPESVKRTEGIHVSDLIRGIEKELFKPDTVYGNELFAQLGFIWERALEIAWRDLLGVRPDEIIVDGVIGSPDGVVINDKVVLNEYKCTWKSTRHSLEDNWRYMTQVKAYCYMIKTVHAEMYLFYVNGDYKQSGPKFKHFELKFTEKELDDNWKMLLNYKDKINA